MSIQDVEARFPALNVIPPSDQRGRTAIIVSVKSLVAKMQDGSTKPVTHWYAHSDKSWDVLNSGFEPDLSDAHSSDSKPPLKMDVSGLNEISLVFLDGRINEIRFKYNKDSSLNNLTEFTSRQSQIFHVPFGTTNVAEKKDSEVAECYDFRATADFGGEVPDTSPTFSLEDVHEREEYEARLRANPERQTPLVLPNADADREAETTRRRYDECVRQREAYGVDTSPCWEWAKER
ncbi:MAG TPA: hypothetical protein VLJ61_07485 [Pyrinomonadaceae bacterium]|nr:hypothetical protein [Pyrinomonadaceae bacterium]